MPRKYGGEPERPQPKKAPKKVGAQWNLFGDVVGAGLGVAGAGAVGGAGRRLGEVRKMGQKHKPKKRTFKYDPSQEGQN